MFLIFFFNKNLINSTCSTNGNGYYVLDDAARFFRDAAKGVALYHADKIQFPDGSAPTTQNLIDAVVSGEDDGNPIARALLPGQVGVDDLDNDDVDRSISRCFARLPLDMFAFLPTEPTPG